jgi:hypothetical protein
METVDVRARFPGGGGGGGDETGQRVQAIACTGWSWSWSWSWREQRPSRRRLSTPHLPGSDPAPSETIF